MTNQSLSLDVRTLNFSRDIIAFCRNEELTVATKPLIDQLIRSATSVGANYAEANNAVSRTDFRNKIFIAKKEAAESRYWLVLLNDLVADKDTCAYLVQECHYILMTLQKIVNTLDKRKKANV